jgi:hypothetical protein
MKEMNWEMGSEFLCRVNKAPRGRFDGGKGPPKVKKQSVGPIPVNLTPLELYTT